VVVTASFACHSAVYNSRWKEYEWCFDLTRRVGTSKLALVRPPENTDKGRVPILGISGLGWWTENGPKRGFMGGLVPDIPKIWWSKGG
jgi:hypothetical protein